MYDRGSTKKNFYVTRIIPFTCSYFKLLHTVNVCVKKFILIIEFFDVIKKIFPNVES